MLRRVLLSTLVVSFGGCALLSPLTPRSGEHKVSVRVTGADGRVPEWVHVYLGTRGERVIGNALEAGIPRGGVRVLRLMSPLHEPVTLPILDQGRDVQLDVRLGTPTILDDVSSAHIVSKRGQTFPLRSLGDGRFVASVDTDDLREGVLVAGASTGHPMSLPGAVWYEPTPQGHYWSQFNPERGKVSNAVTLTPSVLRDREAEPVVRFAEPADSRLYRIVRWHEEQSRQLLVSVRADLTGAVLGSLPREEVAERAAARLEATARSVGERIERTRGLERHLWLLTGVALLNTPEHQLQASDHANVLAREVSPASELWSVYPGVALSFSNLAWRCCREYVRTLTQHPDTTVAEDALFVIATRDDPPEAHAALSKLEKLNPKAARTEFARRYLGALRPGQEPPDLRLYAAEERDARIHLESFAGRTVLVSFWATWAKGSAELFVELQRLEEKYRDRGLSVLNVSLNQDPVALARFVAKNRAGLPGTQAIVDPRDRDQLSKVYGILSVPSLVLIGPDGRLLATNADLLREGLEGSLENFFNPR